MKRNQGLWKKYCISAAAVFLLFAILSRSGVLASASRTLILAIDLLFNWVFWGLLWLGIMSKRKYPGSSSKQTMNARSKLLGILCVLLPLMLAFSTFQKLQTFFNL